MPIFSGVSQARFVVLVTPGGFGDHFPLHGKMLPSPPTLGVHIKTPDCVRQRLCSQCQHERTRCRVGWSQWLANRESVQHHMTSRPPADAFPRPARSNRCPSFLENRITVPAAMRTCASAPSRTSRVYSSSQSVSGRQNKKAPPGSEGPCTAGYGTC
jgi:hypothetical protein